MKYAANRKMGYHESLKYDMMKKRRRMAMNVILEKFPFQVIVTVGFYCFMIFLSNQIFRRLEKRNKDIHAQFARKAVNGILLILCPVSVGLQFSSTREITNMLIKSSGLFIAIAGFAAQQTLADVIGGFMLSVSKPFNLGERITLLNSNTTGIVEEITMRHTIICLFDNNRLIIPNSVINKEIILNSNFKDSKSGNYIEITVDFDTDLTLAMDLMRKAVCEHPLVVEKDQVEVLVKNYTTNGVILKTAVYTKDVNDNFHASSDIRLEILRRFQSHGIRIPHQKVDLVTKEG